MPPLRLSLPHRRAPSLYLPPSPSYTAFIHRHINIFRGGVVTCIYAIGIGEEALQLFYQTHLLCFFLFLLEKYTPMAMTMAMATQSLHILEKKWSRVREKQGIEISRLYPDGYLKLREDPAAWIQLNPKDRVQRVRRLELYLDDDDVEEIGDSIGELTHLTHFSIQEARSLKFLPNVITRLHNLQVLEIHDSTLEELPASLGELHSLTHLSLSLCDNLQELPASLGELHSLTHLSLSLCNNLQELPASLGELHSLTHLSLSSCNNLQELPASLGELHSLTHLSLSLCNNLQELPASLGELHSLTHLSLSSCNNLQELPASLGELHSLTHLSLSLCDNLQELPASLGELHSLTHLSLSLCNNLQELPASLGELHSLTHLSLSSCNNLQELPASLGELHSLTHLSLSSCNDLQALPASLGELHSLTHLSLSSCNNLQALPASLGELHSLTHLSLSSCNNLQALPASLGELHSLTHLALKSCYILRELPASLGELETLAEFTLCHCDAVKFIPNMKVETLCFESDKENHFPSFGKLSNLQTSVLGVSQIPINSEGMPRLLFLDLRKSQIKHFSVLGNIKNLPKLGILSLPECFRLETVPFDLDDSLIISVDETYTRKTWKELKTEMMWSFSNPLTGCSSRNPFNISPHECLLLNEAPMLLNLNSYESVRLLDLSICEDDAEKLNSIKELSQLTHLYIEQKDSSDYIDLKYLTNTITRLRHLSLQLPRYESFSNCLDMLTNLESLDLYLSGNKLPENIDVSVLVNLRCLTLQHGEMRSLPDSIAKLSNLKTLVLHYCYDLKSLPPDMNLVKLKLIDTFIHPLPIGLRHLEIFHIFKYGLCKCENVNIDLKESVNLETLSITCYNTKFLPALEGLLNLQELQLKDCFNLRKMPNLGKLSKLCTLNISGTRIKTLPGCITNLHNLKDLILPKCFKKESLPHNFGKEPVVIIDDIHEEYYKRMGFYDSYYKITSDDDNEITSDIDELVDEEDAKISHEGHNTMQSTLHQLQNLPGDQTPVLGDSSEFGQAIINDVVSSPQYIFLDKSEVTQFPEDLMGEYSQCRYVQNVTSGFEVWRTHMPNNENLILHQTETFSIDTANQVEGHHSQGRNDAICEDSKHALHSLQNQHSKVNNNQQSDDSKVMTQKIDIPLEKIQSQMSKNITIVQAAKNLEDDNEITSDSEVVIDEEDTRISQEGHNTVQIPLHQLQNSPADQTLVLGASSEFGQTIINGDVASPHYIFLNKPEVTQFPEASSQFGQAIINDKVASPLSEFSISPPVTQFYEGHHSYGRNDAICEDSQHALHSSQNQQTKINKSNQSDDKKVTTQKIDISPEKIQSLLSLNMTIEEAANQLSVSRSTLKRRMAYLNIQWIRSSKKICKDPKTTKDDV